MQAISKASCWREGARHLRVCGAAGLGGQRWRGGGHLGGHEGVFARHEDAGLVNCAQSAEGWVVEWH